MGNPAYDAKRSAEQAEHEKREAASKAVTAAIDTFTALMAGTAFLSIEPGNVGYIVRVRHDN